VTGAAGNELLAQLVEQLLEAQTRPPVKLVGPSEAARILGVSRSYFDTEILPTLSTVAPTERLVRIPVDELGRWIARNLRAPRRNT
jgi:hypothetical protein